MPSRARGSVMGLASLPPALLALKIIFEFIYICTFVSISHDRIPVIFAQVMHCISFFYVICNRACSLHLLNPTNWSEEYCSQPWLRAHRILPTTALRLGQGAVVKIPRPLSVELSSVIHTGIIVWLLFSSTGHLTLFLRRQYLMSQVWKEGVIWQLGDIVSWFQCIICHELLKTPLSLFTDQAILYHLKQNTSLLKCYICVIVQIQINPTMWSMLLIIRFMTVDSRGK